MKHASLLTLTAILGFSLTACAYNKSPNIGYVCANNQNVNTQVLNSDRLAVSFDGKVVPMTRAVSASGTRYIGEGWQWWVKGYDATLTKLEDGKSYAEPKGVTCRDTTAD